MAFTTFETSAAAGNPVQIFLFRYGTASTDIYAYTDHDQPLTIDGVTYEPVPIERDTIEADGTLDKSALKINTDIGTGLAEIFRVYPPSSVVSLTIRQGHVGDPDSEFLVIWSGRVMVAERIHGELAISGEPISTSLRRPGLRRHYQFGCMHQLYGPQCSANKAAATVSATIASVAGATITLNAGWQGSFTPAKFTGGMVEWLTDSGSTDRRTILRVTGDTLSLSGIPTGLAASDAVDVILGCNHKPFTDQGGDCEGLHNNIQNFGGCPFIPVKNPIGSYNNYY